MLLTPKRNPALFAPFIDRPHWREAWNADWFPDKLVCALFPFIGVGGSGSWQPSMTSAAFGADDTTQNFNTETMYTKIDQADLLVTGGSQIRCTFTGSLTSGNDFVWDHTYVGQAASGWNTTAGTTKFNAVPTQLKWNNGANGWSVAGSGTSTANTRRSDPLSQGLPTTQGWGIAMHLNNGAARNLSGTTTGSGTVACSYASGDTSANQNQTTTAQSVGFKRDLLSLLEVFK